MLFSVSFVSDQADAVQIIDDLIVHLFQILMVYEVLFKFLRAFIQVFAVNMP